jgi:hypothetical protein|tara:strand:+ start:753 stop:914 length:162 start_codon:yes stop_codon:yes gene_type:complete
LEVVREGSLEGEPCSGHRMVERQVGSMEERSAELQTLAMATIGTVPDQGMADS